MNVNERVNIPFRKFKQKYVAIIDNYFRINKCEFFPPFDGPGLLKLTHIVALTKLAVQRGELVCINLSNLLAKYDVTVVDGFYKLIAKLKLPTDQIRYYISCEDSYSLIVNAHVQTNHGGLEKIMKILNRQYCVSEMAVRLILSLCNVCKGHGNCGRGSEKPLKSKDKWQIAIGVIHKTDEPFGYILIVVDRATGFVHLRPLISRDTMTVAIELLKIYGDFGKPLLLETNAKLFFQEVVSRMKILNQGYYSPVVYSPIDLSELTYRIGKYLSDWQNMTKSKNWTFGVHVVQWRLNNTQDFTMKTHFGNLFYRLPNHHLAVKDDQLNFSHNAHEMVYEHVAIELIDREDLNKSILAPDVTPAMEEQSLNLVNLEESIQGNIIVKPIQADQANVPAAPYIDKAQGIKQPFQISNYVSMSVAKKTHLINQHSQVLHHQQTEELSTDVEVLEKLQKELDQFVRSLDKTLGIEETTSNKVQSSKDVNTDVLANMKDKFNRSVVERTFEGPDISTQTHLSIGHISNNNEESNFINDNAAKITLLSVEIEEDSD